MQLWLANLFHECSKDGLPFNPCKNKSNFESFVSKWMKVDCTVHRSTESPHMPLSHLAYFSPLIS